MGTPADVFLPNENPRGRRMRMDTASILKRFFFCEQSLIVSMAGWAIPIAPFQIKTTFPRLFWENAMTANAMRDRVFELHYPSRMMNIGDDAPLVAVIREAVNAPGVEAFILSMAQVFEPALLRAYRHYIGEGDFIADGPTLRFLKLAAQEKEEHISTLTRFANQLLTATPERRAEAEAWANAIESALEQVGGISLEEGLTGPSQIELPGRVPFKLSDTPARDARFHQCRFYWPDIIVSNFPYGQGLRLQLRSAVSHINEVWAVDAAAMSLNAFADILGWEFVFEAARWTYDEARHCQMGYDRLRGWGFEEHEIPQGTYIFDSAHGKPPITVLGMLSYFETKNIGKKNQRARAFADYNDQLSQHDMEFDWADETIHAHYGAKWIGILSETRPDIVLNVEALRLESDALVDRIVATATDADRADILQTAEAMIAKAEKLSRVGQ